MLTSLIAGMSLGTFVFPDWDIQLFFFAFAIFLATGFAVDRMNARRALNCPNCTASLLNKMQFGMDSRACPLCEQRIVATGRLRSPAVMNRRNRMRAHSFLANWFWVPITLGLFTLIAYPFRGNFLDGCEHCVMLFPAMAISSIWTYLRTWQRRYLIPALISAIMLPLSIVVFAQS